RAAKRGEAIAAAEKKLQVVVPADYQDPKQVEQRAKAERAKAEAAGRALLAQLQGEVKSAIESSRFKEALERARRPDPAIHSLPEGDAEVAAAIDRVLNAARERVARERAELL